ncbi:MAG: DUF4331 family protein [Rhizobiales bacterium]|nr:DUF4331 family protein [Hyphomicrobiales bacterium]
MGRTAPFLGCRGALATGRPSARDYRVFAGQRDDGFYADIQSIFDLDFTFGADRNRNTPTKPFDSQGGFNVHTIALEIPFAELRGAEIAGVYATTSRRGVRGRGEQVGRQGNPLFNEALVALRDKDRYSRTLPSEDDRFREYARNPELSRLLGGDGAEMGAQRPREVFFERLQRARILPGMAAGR